jgi:hypothetical protein
MLLPAKRDFGESKRAAYGWLPLSLQGEAEGEDLLPFGFRRILASLADPAGWQPASRVRLVA